MERKLVIVSASSSIRKEPPEPIPAIERYNGIYFRVLRKHLQERKLKNIDVLIVSEKLGLIWSHDKISYHEPHVGKWGSLSLDRNAIRKQRTENLEKLRRIVNQYSEIYVNVGLEYVKLVEGFEKLVTCKVTYATGRGLGPKAVHMKQWLISQ